VKLRTSLWIFSRRLLNNNNKTLFTVLGAEVFTRRYQCTADDYDYDEDGDLPRDHHTTSGDVTRALAVLLHNGRPYVRDYRLVSYS